MDGDLQASSVEGQGSTFSFDIALPACDAAEEAPRERLSLPPLDTTVTILVAEDNPVNQAVIRRQLEVLKIQATIVDDGEQALTCMLEQSFDVVLMDLHMPKLDGLGATRAARERGYEGPIVAMTASALLEDRAAAKEAGMTAFLEKPVTLEALVGCLLYTSPSPRD